MSWKEVWELNYKGQSPEAKELEGFMKANYKKHNYIPWATMVRLLYMQDPDAKLDVVLNRNSEVVHTCNNYTESISSETRRLKTGEETENSSKTENRHLSNMVVIECTFLGKTFKEYYPIQDNAYNAPYYYDSNMVNKAIQRAKAKIISIATGLAFRLYEDGDLQFEEDKNKAETPNSDKVVVAKKEPPVHQAAVDEITDDENTHAKELLTLLRATDESIVNDIIKNVNIDLIKLYKFSINLEQEDSVIIDKLSKIKNLPMFAKVIKTKIDRSTSK